MKRPTEAPRPDSYALSQGTAAAFAFADVAVAAQRQGRDVGELPFAMRILLENIERQRLASGDDALTREVAACVAFEESIGEGLSLKLPRVILPDSSGIPALMDLAALRSAVSNRGIDPQVATPAVPVDLVVDHSLQVDQWASRQAQIFNMGREIERNSERYRFLRWAQNAFPNLRVFPPGSGIIHQINLEHIAQVVQLQPADGLDVDLAYPDFVIGGDSHTPMINGLGVLGWGVGGIDAEAAMLGVPYIFGLPKVIGVRLSGRLASGATTTDLVLHVTQRLRREKVTGAFVEYFGGGAADLAIAERATIANMAPEYGATIGYFPIDSRTVEYVRATRSQAHAQLVEDYARANSLYREDGAADPDYPRIVEIDLSEIRPSVAGPKRPQDRLALDEVKCDFRKRLSRPLDKDGFAAAPVGDAASLNHGSIVIAAITSCTNTSNPRVMLAAGLLAHKAAERGLLPPRHVKTSMAPGSRFVTQYLEETGLLAPLERLGFHVVGYGCTTCGGKSGPLDEEIATAIEADDIVAAAVLSGNRNFEGRIHKLVRANYIMSPPLVIAFALAGRVDLDLDSEPLAHDAAGVPVFLKDLWPAPDEIEALLPTAENGERLRKSYAGRNESNDNWNRIEAPSGSLFDWDPGSSYLVEPPFFTDGAAPINERIEGARVLGMYGDSLTTDHISPGGEIPLDSEAGRYLMSLGIAQRDFNTYVSRRGNHHVMVRATFANLRIKNRLTPDREGGWTRLMPEGVVVSVFDAATAYDERGVPLIVIGGSDYGTGSSRDWAAKGTALLGVKAVIARSFERIHRSNLIGMGVIPLRFDDGESAETLGLTGLETYTIDNICAAVEAGEAVRIEAHGDNGRSASFTATPDILNASEREILMSGGILPRVMRSIESSARPDASAMGHEHA